MFPGSAFHDTANGSRGKLVVGADAGVRLPCRAARADPPYVIRRERRLPTEVRASASRADGTARGAALGAIAVEPIERVTVFAVRCALPMRQLTTRVLGQRDRLHVRRVHAAAVATEVVDRKAFGDRPDEMFVAPPVRVAPAGGIEGPVAAGGDTSLPVPAAGLVICDAVALESFNGGPERPPRTRLVSSLASSKGARTANDALPALLDRDVDVVGGQCVATRARAFHDVKYSNTQSVAHYRSCALHSAAGVLLRRTDRAVAVRLIYSARNISHTED